MSLTGRVTDERCRSRRQGTLYEPRLLMDEMLNEPCPCGSGLTFESCCHGYLLGTCAAQSAVALMRSRYVAHVVGDTGYLAKSWHPNTRPQQLSLEPSQRWLGLTIKRVEAGGAHDEVGVVEYVARFKIGGRGHRLHEVSRFERLDGSWVYVDGDLLERERTERDRPRARRRNRR